MCLGLPMRVVSGNEYSAVVERGDERRTVSMMLVGEVPVGTAVLVHINSAVRVLEEDEAVDIEGAIAGLEASARGEPVDAYFAGLVASERVVATPVDALAARLRAAYEAVAVQMEGLPIVNPRLGIEVLAFQEWNGGHAGLVITPWFLNVIFVPPVGTPEFAPGTRVPREFPAGRLEFVTSHLDGVGPMESCSLFSPMNEFRDMPHALEVARDAAQALFTPAPVSVAASTEPAPPTTTPDAEPPSRRALFRRALSLR
ncbi:MAG: [NiFe]-hydrogenase assembly chaperone HybE [Myxococcales bacterium]|nr:[NiFe]-hydrogenase assembly chaperone HybE [Myxococcales bacterium]